VNEPSTVSHVKGGGDPSKHFFGTTYGFYLHADLRAAEQAIALIASPKTKKGLVLST
jgi:hypothetical protein